MEETSTRYVDVSTNPKGAIVMGQLDQDPIPPYAVTMWADGRYIYAALPMTAGGIPYITKFDLTEGGFNAALNILRKAAPEAPRPTHAAPANYTIPKHQPQVETKLSAAQMRLRAETTESQRENARKVLAKLGLKP